MSHRRGQCLERDLDHVAPPLELALRGALGIAERVVEVARPHDPVGTRAAGDREEATCDHGRDADPLELLGERSAATRASASSRWKDDAVDLGRRQHCRHLAADPPHHAHVADAAACDQDGVEQFADHTLHLQLAEGVDR
jgi:hypothetical protein